MPNEGYQTAPAAGVKGFEQTIDYQRFSLQPLPHLKAWIGGFVALGVAARCLRFLICAPLWPDEAFLAASYLDHGYLQMLTEPLSYHQVAPPGYLWIQLTIVKLFGFHEYSLRILSLIAGIASLFVFRRLAAQLTDGAAYLFCVAVFSVAYPAIRYSTEAKPYGIDLFVGLGLAALYVEWTLRGQTRRWTWLLAAACGLSLWFSLPAVFVAGGLSLAVGYNLFQHRKKELLIPYLGLNLLLVGSFVGLQVALRTMTSADLEGMRSCWEQAFPPLDNSLQTVTWFVAALTGDVTPFPIGSVRGGSSATVACCLIAVLCLRSNRRMDLAILFLAPLGLNLIAAALRRYPFGGGVRFTLYSGGGICLLAGLGAACIAAWLTQRFTSRKVVLTAMVALILLGSGSILRDFLRPYKAQDILRARSFAQWFWFNKAFDAELVCLKADWELDFSPFTFEGGESSLYVCNRRIYSARHRTGDPPDLTRISATRPLRCALFRDERWTFNQPAFDKWLQSMQDEYALVAHEQYPFPVFYRDKDYKHTCFVDLYEFVPKAQAKAGRKVRTAFNRRSIQ